MKSKISKLQILGCFIIIPAAALLAGCNDKDNSTSATTNTPAMTASDNGASNTNAATNADNTARNAQDRNGTTLTPGDQGNSDSDRQITQKIRQNVVSSTNNYSMTAKNIKIITVDGKVTLRGPVNNDGEKTGIEGIAKDVAGAGNVDDQLEVKTNQ